MRRAAGALLALGVLAGCGGESSSEQIRKDVAASATPAPSAPADDDGDPDTIPLDLYRLRADKLCETTGIRAEARLAPLRAKVREKPTLARSMRLNAAAVEFSEPLFEELTALPPADGHEDEIRAMNQLGTDTIRYLKRSVKAYRAGRTAAAKRAMQINVAAATVYDKAAVKLGLEECGSQYVYPGE